MGAVMGADVYFDDEEKKLVESGQLIFLGVACFDPKKGTLEIFCSGARPVEETHAILKKFLRMATVKTVERDTGSDADRRQP
jgi:hypothetical protein